MSDRSHLPPFENRWLIRGTLTTRSPLHVGDGSSEGRVLQGEDGRPRTDAEVARVSRGLSRDGKSEKPFIPGASIRGVFSSAIARDGDPVWEALLGHSRPDEADTVGGKLEFHDARWNGDTISGTGKRPQAPPHWDASLHTAVAPGVAINRKLRSAEDQKLYHVEYVPEGATFDFELTGQNLNESEVTAVLRALDNFNRHLSLGKNQASGWGVVAWKPTSVHKLDSANLDAWLSQEDAGWENLPPLPADEFEKMTSSEAGGAAPGEERNDLLSLEVSLSFDSFFMVHDPSWKEPRSHLDDSKPHRALRRDGKPEEPELPSTSIRGVLRSRAEMILRTLGQDACTPERPCDPVRSPDDLEKLCPACRLFGASGWRSPIQVGRFTFGEREATKRFQQKEEQNFFQEFVAIDRFTGGAASSAKFSAGPSWKAGFDGSIQVDRRRLRIVDEDESLLGLLALLFRDLSEGDLTFGWGSTKGYGACTAEVRSDSLALLHEKLDPFRKSLAETTATHE